MKFFVCSIHDAATDSYTGLYSFRSEGEAHRSLFDAVSNRESSLFLHPEDFYVYQIGVFDDDAGLFEAFDVPKAFRPISFYHRLVVHAASGGPEDLFPVSLPLKN